MGDKTPYPNPDKIILEEVLRIAQDEQGLELPKTFSTKPSRLWGKTSK